MDVILIMILDLIDIDIIYLNNTIMINNKIEISLNAEGYVAQITINTADWNGEFNIEDIKDSLYEDYLNYLGNSDIASRAEFLEDFNSNYLYVENCNISYINDIIYNNLEDVYINDIIHIIDIIKLLNERNIDMQDNRSYGVLLYDRDVQYINSNNIDAIICDFKGKFDYLDTEIINYRYPNLPEELVGFIDITEYVNTFYYILSMSEYNGPYYLFNND